MEDDSLRKFKEELAKKSIERFRCNVCLERASKPLIFCRAGHICCSPCKLQLKDCPVCHKVFSEDKNTALEQMLEISIFPCKNEVFGCTIIGEYSEIMKHEHSHCNFKRFKCFLYDDPDHDVRCNDIVNICVFEDHVKNTHEEREVIFCKEELKRDLVIDEDNSFETVDVIEVVLDKDLENSIFLLEHKSFDADTEVLSISYHYVGAIQDAKKYKYFVTIKDAENSTIITAQNKCLPIGVEDDELESRKRVGIDLSTFNNLDKSDEDETTRKELIISVLFDYAENEIKWDFGSTKMGLGVDKKSDCLLTDDKMVQTDDKTIQTNEKMIQMDDNGESNVENMENEEIDVEEKFFDGLSHAKVEENGDMAAEKLKNNGKILMDVENIQKFICIMLLFLAFFGILSFPHFTSVIFAVFIVFFLPICFFKISRMYSKQGGFSYNGYKLF